LFKILLAPVNVGLTWVAFLAEVGHAAWVKNPSKTEYHFI